MDFIFLSQEPNLGLRPATECFTMQTIVNIYRKTEELEKRGSQMKDRKGGEIRTRRTQATFPPALSCSPLFSLVHFTAFLQDDGDGMCHCCSFA